MTVLTASHLSVALGGREVLQGVSLRVNAGELYGIVGPNGAGKTTLLRAILGLIAYRGEVHTAGGIGYVPQRHDVAWDYPITVERMVMTGRVRHIGWLRQPRLADHRAVAAALRRVKLADLADRPIGELSGGQRQRVMIARALSTNPSILLLDEPFTGLDMPTQELLTDLFHELTGDGTAIMMTTHDLPAAMAACDTIAMVAGTIIAHGSPRDLSDPEIWMRTFAVSENSPLLAALGLRQRQETRC